MVNAVHGYASIIQNPYKVFTCTNVMDWKNELREAAEGIIIAIILYLIIQASLMVTLGVEKPLYVVISGSMEPTYEKGDILVVKGVDVINIEKGDIIVFDSPFGGIPIVHRVFDIRIDGEKRFFTTKGDNNPSPDNYYTPQHPGIPEEHIIGVPFIKIPKIGWFQIWLREFIDSVRRCPYPQPV